MEEELQLDPTTYVRATLRQLWERLPLLLLGDLLFWLLSAPALLLFLLQQPAAVVAVLTLIPAWTALLKLLSTADDRPAGARLMLAAFGSHWRRSVALGCLILIPAGLFRLSLSWLNQAETTAAGRLVSGAALLAGLLLLTLYLYAFPLLALHDLPARMALRNGFVLAGRYLTHTLGLLALIVLGVAAAAYLSVGLLLLLPALWGLFIVNNCKLVVALEQGGG